MGLITMMIFLTTLTLLVGWVYLGITQCSPIEDSPHEFVLAVVIGIMMVIPLFDWVHPFIG